MQRVLMLPHRDTRGPPSIDHIVTTMVGFPSSPLLNHAVGFQIPELLVQTALHLPPGSAKGWEPGARLAVHRV